MAESEIDYGAMLQRALRSVVREVLVRTEREGLPGEHHFYLSLRTDHPGTQVPPFLRQRFPEEITVVLQHQFRDLVVDDNGFAVTLRFDGMPARLVVPWEAVVAFFDPTAEFGLRFDMPALAGAATTRGPVAATNAGEPSSPQPAASGASDAAHDAGDESEVAKVLSFGRPRDRRDD
ncbi:MAG TPA: ClpXP protease specificity-enhancing factor SspB [Thermoanaerobaculia bacterium]|nr:ClpXP protease specificity-enhancing factor SspB [Thermoanaerobaculia bacterium]